LVASNPLLNLASMDTDRGRVEAALRSSVVTEDAYLTEIASHLIIAGGKRLRPVMAIAAALAGGAEVADEVIQGGVSVELVHLGSLYHDDVMDEADMRRGTPSVNAVWGNLRAILSGDFLLARASEIAASLGVEVAGLLARTIGRLCEGQISELRTLFQVERTQADYFTSIDGKTASLYSAAARIGGIVSGFDRGRIDSLTNYGTAFGMVFQIVDDILDITATDEELGKPAGHDMVEGVYSLPVLCTLNSPGPAGIELRDLLGGPIEGVALEKALAIVRGGPGVAEAKHLARTFAEQAARCAEQLGSNDATVAMTAASFALLDSVG
jgi:heptaprenyl diphosphate synthase